MAQLHTDRSDSSSQRPWTTYAHYLSIHKQDLCKHILSPHAGTHSCQMDLPLSLSAPPDFGRRLFFFFPLSTLSCFSRKKPSSHLFTTPSLAVYTSRPLHCVFLHTIYCCVSARGAPNCLQLHNDLSVRVPFFCCCCCCFHTISRTNYKRQLRQFERVASVPPRICRHIVS